MIGYIIFLTAVIGTLIASYFDLKTTEVPDFIAIYMAIMGLILNAVNSFITENFIYLKLSLIFGLLFAIIGYLKYLLKLWGGADFLLLAAIGFLIPYLPSEFSPVYKAIWPFPLTIFLNLLILGSLYSIIYAIFIFFKKKEAVYLFLKNIKNYRKGFIQITFLFIPLIFLSTYLTQNRFLFKFYLMSYLAISFFLILYIFLRTIQKDVMERRIPSERLKEGDVLAEDIKLYDRIIKASRIEGLTKDDVEFIKKNVGWVKIMEGIPYIPSFFLTIIISFTFGDIITFLFPFIPQQLVLFP